MGTTSSVVGRAIIGLAGVLANILAAASAGAAERPLYLEQLTWVEIGAALEQKFDTVIVLVGATEQHGPHLAISSDSVTADCLAPGIARKLGRTLIAPVIRTGISPHHMQFPGTITLRESVLENVLRDYIHSLAWHGFRHIVILPTHGGNFTTVKRLVDKLAPLYPHLDVLGFSDADAYIKALQDTTQRLGIDMQAAGSHAGLSEAAMILHCRPELVRPAQAQPGFMGDAYAMGDKMNKEGTHAISPIGVLGDPRTATAEAGAAYIASLENLLVDFVEQGRSRWTSKDPQSLPHGGLAEATGRLADGVRLRRRGDLAGARAFFRSRPGEDPEAVLELARTEILAGEFATADDLLGSIADDPDPAVRARAVLEISRRELYRGRFDRAIELQRQVADWSRQAGDQQAVAQRLLYIGHLYVQTERHAQAIDSYQQALDLSPQISDVHVDGQHLLGLAEVGQGGLLQAGARLRVLEEGALGQELAAHVRRFYHLNGEILLAKGRTQDALTNLRLAIRVYDHPLYRDALGRALLADGKPEAAEAEFRRLTELTDARLDIPMLYIRAYFQLGEIYRRRERPKEAGAMYRKFLSYWGSADIQLPEIRQAAQRLREL